MTSAEQSGPAPRPCWRDEPVHRRIRGQGLIMAVIGLVVLGLAVTDLARGMIGPLGAAVGFVGGALVGVIAARVNRFSWDAGSRRVVARIDRLGLAILVAMVLAHLSRDWLLGHWIHGALLTALGVWISAGTLIGRVLGTRRGVATVLRTVGVKPLDDRPRPE
jgi:hypothetical protein